MSAGQEKVKIKGQKKGLIFILDDKCGFDELVSELQYKLENTHTNILTGPIIHVNIKTGQRVMTPKEKERVKQTLAKKGNLIVQKFEHIELKDKPDLSELQLQQLKVLKGVIRSGQTIQEKGDILYIGDVNPGGNITSTGSIFVMGSLRGMAHAGIAGDQQAVIASSYLKPTQLRIAEQISRPPDEWEHQDAHMEFAYLNNQQMKIEKLSILYRIRPDLCIYKGE